MSKRRLISVLFVSLILASSCKKEVKTWQPNPPYPGLEVKMLSFSIDASKDTVIKLPNGTSISIPAESMEGMDGVAIKGKYTLQYREFHDAVDILLSGIPMDISIMGERQTLRTAGMFEIDAMQGDSKLRIVEGKSVDVRFASRYKDANYDFFYMNPETALWEWVDLPNTEVNQEKINAENALKEKSPSIFLGDKFFVLNYDRFLDIYFNNDYQKIFKYRNSGSIKKKLQEYNFKLYDIKVEGELVFLRSYYHPAEMLWKEIDGKEFPRWLNDFNFEWAKDKSGTWVYSNYSIVSLGNNIYQISYSKTGKVFTKKMEAIIPLRSILNLSAGQWQQKYDEAMSSLKAEQERVDLMAETYRSFSVKRLGTYNFDCTIKDLNEWTTINANFTMLNNPVQDGSLVIILGDNSGFVKVKPEEYSKMRLKPSTGQRLVMLQKNNEIGLFSAEKMLKINADSLKALNYPSFTFNLDQKKVNDAIELRKLLGFK